MLMNTQCITLTENNFQPEVMESKIPVLVDCWASWCSSSQQASPIIDECAIAFAGQIKVGRLDVATSEALAMYYQIRAVPTLLFFKDGQVVERLIGGVSKQSLMGKLHILFPGSNPSRSRIVWL